MSKHRKPTNDDHDELLTDLADDFKRHVGQKPATRADVAELQRRVEGLEEVARHMTAPGGVADGERLLAKAAGAYTTPESLLALGEREISDATEMGVFASHVASGDLTEAQNLLIDARERGRVAKAADAAQAAESALDAPLGDFDNRRGLSELTARFASMECTLEALEQRLAQLERPRPAPPVPGERVVVKAPGTKRTKTQIADNLLRQIDRYIDSPAAAGALSSLVQQGKFSEVRPVLEQAKQAHETEKVRQERKSWDR